MPYRTVTRVLDEPCLGRLVLYGDYTMEYYGSQQDAAPPAHRPGGGLSPAAARLF